MSEVEDELTEIEELTKRIFPGCHPADLTLDEIYKHCQNIRRLIK